MIGIGGDTGIKTRGSGTLTEPIFGHTHAVHPDNKNICSVSRSTDATGNSVVHTRNGVYWYSGTLDPELITKAGFRRDNLYYINFRDKEPPGKTYLKQESITQQEVYSCILKDQPLTIILKVSTDMIPTQSVKLVEAGSKELESQTQVHNINDYLIENQQTNLLKKTLKQSNTKQIGREYKNTATAEINTIEEEVKVENQSDQISPTNNEAQRQAQLKARLLHHQLGHPSKSVMRKILANQLRHNKFTAQERKTLLSYDTQCPSCAIHKTVKRSLNRESTNPASPHIFYKIHVDLKGPFKHTVWGGFRYSLTVVDDYSRKVWSILLRNKGEATDELIKLIYITVKRIEKPLKTIQCDGGGEFMNQTLDTFCQHTGIEKIATPRQEPNLNGVAERYNRTIFEKAYTLLTAASRFLNKHWLSYAIEVATFLINNTPNSHLDSILSAEQVWSNTTIDIKLLRPFGCLSYVVRTEREKQHTHNRTYPGFLVGYDRTPSVYRIYLPYEHKIVRSTHVKFHQNLPIPLLTDYHLYGRIYNEETFKRAQLQLESSEVTFPDLEDNTDRDTENATQGSQTTDHQTNAAESQTENEINQDNQNSSDRIEISPPLEQASSEDETSDEEETENLEKQNSPRHLNRLLKEIQDFNKAGSANTRLGKLYNNTNGEDVEERADSDSASQNNFMTSVTSPFFMSNPYESTFNTIRTSNFCAKNKPKLKQVRFTDPLSTTYNVTLEKSKSEARAIREQTRRTYNVSTLEDAIKPYRLQETHMIDYSILEDFAKLTDNDDYFEVKRFVPPTEDFGDRERYLDPHENERSSPGDAPLNEDETSISNRRPTEALDNPTVEETLQDPLRDIIQQAKKRTPPRPRRNIETRHSSRNKGEPSSNIAINNLNTEKPDEVKRQPRKGTGSVIFYRTPQQLAQDPETLSAVMSTANTKSVNLHQKVTRINRLMRKLPPDPEDESKTQRTPYIAQLDRLHAAAKAQNTLKRLKREIEQIRGSLRKSKLSKRMKNTKQLQTPERQDSHIYEEDPLIKETHILCNGLYKIIKEMNLKLDELLKNLSKVNVQTHPDSATLNETIMMNIEDIQQNLTQIVKEKGDLLKQKLEIMTQEQVDDTFDKYDIDKLTTILEATNLQTERDILPANYEPPKSYREAMQRSQEKDRWEEAIAKEILALIETETFSFKILPKGKKAIGCKWVLKIKQNSDRTIERFKARLVIQGFSQTLGEDFFEVFSPVSKMESVRTMIALAAQFDMEIHQLDVANAFLNGVLEDEEVYMQIPQGLMEIKQNNELIASKIKGYNQMKKDQEQAHLNRQVKPVYVLKLHRALYGLKQSPRIWSDLLSTYLQEKGFKRLRTDTCVFIRGTGANQIILSVRVDDILVLTSNTDELKKLKLELEEKFKMTDMGDVEWYCAMKVTRDRDKGIIMLSQQPYIEAILDKYKLSDIKPAATPYRSGIIYSKNQCPITEEDKTSMENIPYRPMIGSLMYALNTRPDIAFAVTTLSRYATNPGKEHYKGVMRVFQYLKATKTKVLTYRKSNNITIDTSILNAEDIESDQKNLILNREAWCDADLAGNIDDRKSTSGTLVYLNGGLISFSSTKQKVTALSTMEAEYIALAHVTQDIIWFHQFLEELGFMSKMPTIIHEDNQPCMKLAENPQVSKRAKHIDIKFHFVRDHIQAESIVLKYCPSKVQLADILTKALPEPQFLQLRDQLLGYEPGKSLPLTEVQQNENKMRKQEKIQRYEEFQKEKGSTKTKTSYNDKQETVETNYIEVNLYPQLIRGTFTTFFISLVKCLAIFDDEPRITNQGENKEVN